ncbi:MAG TPA: hypothetical protein VGO47_03715 [Chlamydiales bacterium]|jgi:hypothetical protein|nr:hypothetical protein [Chlamydiales bacterium]
MHICVLHSLLINPSSERSHSQSQIPTQPQPSTPTLPSEVTNRPQRKLTEAEEYIRSVQLRDDSATTPPMTEAPRPAPLRRNSGLTHEIAESRRLSSITIGPDSPKLKHKSSGTLTSAIAGGGTKRRTPELNNTPHINNPNPNVNLPLGYPPELPELLDGTHHTDELGTRFSAGWPVLEKWLLTIGGGDQPGDYGKVVIIYR